MEQVWSKYGASEVSLSRPTINKVSSAQRILYKGCRATAPERTAVQSHINYLQRVTQEHVWRTYGAGMELVWRRSGAGKKQVGSKRS